MIAAEEIKQKLDLIEVVGEYVRLQPAGGQALKGLCPFHGEKTPSFYAHRDKQFWHCFGCGEGGDVFTFYQKMENVDFRDALKELARRAGVQLPDFDPKMDSERAVVLAVLEDAARFYEAALKHVPTGDRARAYLAKRGLKGETVAEFRLGYAPASWDAAVKALSGKGHALDKIVAAGLAIPSDRNRSHYDRFRDRIMIPFINHKGQVIGFTGRVLPDSPEADKAGKYINTPETIVFKKREFVFGFNIAKPHIKAANFAILVEGNLDVISSHQIGVKNVVAVSGTALTGFQLKQLFGARGGSSDDSFKIAVVFDNDDAGRKTSQRDFPKVLLGLREAWGQKVEVYGFMLPDGCKDPDEVIQKNPEQWKAVIRDAREWVAICFDLAMNNFNYKDAQAPSKVVAKLKDVLKILEEIDPVRFDYWVHKLGESLRVSDGAIKQQIRATASPRDSIAIPFANKPVTAGVETREERVAKRLLSLMLGDPALFEAHVGVLDERFPEGPLRSLAKKLAAYYTENAKAPALQPPFFSWYASALQADPNLPALEPILLLKDRDLPEWTPEQLAQEAAVCAQELEKAAVKKTEKELVGALAEAEQRGDRAASIQIAKRLEALARRLYN